MRWTLAVVLGAMLAFTAACQDQEARLQNQRLQAELETLRSQQTRGGDDVLKLLLAQRGDEGLDRRLNSITEDLRGGLESIRKGIDESRRDTDRRIEDLEGRLRRVADFEAGLADLRTAIERLDSKARGLDPTEVLSLHKDLVSKDIELRKERESHEAIKAEIESLRGLLQKAEAELVQAKEDITGLRGEDISRHPEYRKLLRENRELRDEMNRARSDYENLDKRYNELVEQLRRGTNSSDESTARPVAPDSADYAFVGEVALVTKRGNSPSLVMVTVKSGRVPDLNTELVVLDAENRRVCSVRVTRHWHTEENEDLPVEEIGAQAIDERPNRPITKGDKVVWVRGEDNRSAGGE